MNNYKFSSWDEVTGDFSYLEKRIRSLLDGWGMVNPEMLDEVAPELRAQVLREYLEANRMSALALQGEALVLPAGPPLAAPPVSSLASASESITTSPGSSPLKVTVSSSSSGGVEAGAAPPALAPAGQMQPAADKKRTSGTSMQVASGAPWLSSELRDSVVGKSAKFKPKSRSNGKIGISLTLDMCTVYLMWVTAISLVGLPLAVLMLYARSLQRYGSGFWGFLVNIVAFLAATAGGLYVSRGLGIIGLLALIGIVVPALVGLASVIFASKAFLKPRRAVTK